MSKSYLSDEAKSIAVISGEVKMLQESVTNSLILTRQKLLPLMDEGFANKNRKKKKEVDEWTERAKKYNAQIQDQYKQYSDRILELIKVKKTYELEKCLNEITMDLTNTVNINSLYTKLRLDIIHAQIMQTEFFKFKRVQKERADTNARKELKKIMFEPDEGDKLDELLE